MALATLGPVTDGCRQRLVAHYGAAAEHWLTVVPAMLQRAAADWDLELVGYHDAGCASVVALARASDGQQAICKAWYERSRYANEVAALHAWPQHLVPRVLGTSDELGVAALELIGGHPGGGAEPRDAQVEVAKAIGELHSTPVPAGLPSLDGYLTDTVLPRISWRHRALGDDIPPVVLDTVTAVAPDPSRRVLLHADLYRENVLFAPGGRPVFIDPLPMVGDAAFDWAFWVLYHRLTAAPQDRLDLAVAVSGLPPKDLTAWCRLIAVDGLLYYRTVGDSRAATMKELLSFLGPQQTSRPITVSA